ncbi:GyrI-like domain-containing protein, partial [Paraglaciecola sp.]|uniref:GyrI-like domain-containing protein n=1 Tax=Paraglaciecola sp. TaxID=1920173 RepID=UPI003EF4338D
GVNKSPYISYIGIKTKCSQAEIGECMNKDFIELRNYIQEHPDLKSGQAFSIYHHWDIVKGLVEYTAAIPVSDPQNVVSTGFVLGEIPATKTYTIRHIGPYDYVGNAWSTLYNMQQNKEIKCNKRIHPFEVYLNDPTDTAPDKLITEVNFPLK